MRALEMTPGHRYRLKNDGKVVEFSHATMILPHFMIVHPPGESDTQSCFGIPRETECEEVFVEDYVGPSLMKVLKECGTDRQKLIWLLHYIEANSYESHAAGWIKRRREISNVAYVEQTFDEMLRS